MTHQNTFMLCLVIFIITLLAASSTFLPFSEEQLKFQNDIRQNYSSSLQKPNENIKPSEINPLPTPDLNVTSILQRFAHGGEILLTGKELNQTQQETAHFNKIKNATVTSKISAVHDKIYNAKANKSSHNQQLSREEKKTLLLQKLAEQKNQNDNNPTHNVYNSNDVTTSKSTTQPFNLKMKLSNSPNTQRLRSDRLTKISQHDSSSATTTRTKPSNFTIINIPLNNSLQSQYDDVAIDQPQQLKLDPNTNNDNINNMKGDFATQDATFSTQQAGYFAIFTPEWGLRQWGQSDVAPPSFIDDNYQMPPPATWYEDELTHAMEAGTTFTEYVYMLDNTLNTVPPTTTSYGVIDLTVYVNNQPVSLERLSCKGGSNYEWGYGQPTGAQDFCDVYQLVNNNLPVLDTTKSSCVETPAGSGMFVVKLTPKKSFTHNPNIRYELGYYVSNFGPYSTIGWFGVRAGPIDFTKTTLMTHRAGMRTVALGDQYWDGNSANLPLKSPILTGWAWQYVLADRFENLIAPAKVTIPLLDMTFDYPTEFLEMTYYTSPYGNYNAEGDMPANMMLVNPVFAANLGLQNPTTFVYIPFEVDPADPETCFSRHVHVGGALPVLTDPLIELYPYLWDYKNPNNILQIALAFTIYTYNPQPTLFWGTTPVQVHHEAEMIDYIPDLDLINVKREIRRYEVMYMDRYGNKIPFEGAPNDYFLPQYTAVSPDSNIVINTIGQNVLCPRAYCPLNNGRCCTGFLCTFEFEILHTSAAIDTCRYTFGGTTQTYPLQTTPYHRYVGYVDNIDELSYPALHASFPLEKYEGYKWHCRLNNGIEQEDGGEGDDNFVWFPCLESSINEYFCNTGTTHVCSISIVEQKCLNPRTLSPAPNGDQSCLTSAPSDFVVNEAMTWDITNNNNSCQPSTPSAPPKFDLKCIVDMTTSTPVVQNSYLEVPTYIFLNVQQTWKFILRNINNQTLTAPSQVDVKFFINYDGPCDPTVTAPSDNMLCKVSNVNTIVDPTTYNIILTFTIPYNINPIPEFIWIGCLIDNVECIGHGTTVRLYAAGDPDGRNFFITYQPKLAESTKVRYGFPLYPQEPVIVYDAAQEFQASLYYEDLPYAGWFKVDKQHQIHIWPFDPFLQPITQHNSDIPINIAIIRNAAPAGGFNIAQGESVQCLGSYEEIKLMENNNMLNTLLFDFNPTITNSKLTPRNPTTATDQTHFFQPNTKCWWDVETKTYILQFTTRIATRLVMGPDIWREQYFTTFVGNKYDFPEDSPKFHFVVAPHDEVHPNILTTWEIGTIDQNSMKPVQPQQSDDDTGSLSFTTYAGTTFYRTANIIDKYQNPVFPIQTTVGNIWPEIGLFVDYNRTLYTNFGADVVMTQVYTMQSSATGGLMWVMLWRNFGALQYQSFVQYNEQLLSPIIINTIPNGPALGKVNGFAQNITLISNGNENGNGNTNNNGEIEFVLDQIIRLQLYDKWGNIVAPPQATSDDNNDNHYLNDFTPENIRTLYYNKNTQDGGVVPTNQLDILCARPRCVELYNITRLPEHQGRCCDDNGLCYITFLNLTQNYPDIVCVYQLWEDLFEYSGFMLTPKEPLPFTYAYSMPQKMTQSVYQYKCIIAENNQGVAENPYYLDNLKPTQIATDANRLEINKIYIDCNSMAIQQQFCNSQTTKQISTLDPIHTSTIPTECPIRIMKRVCYDIVFKKEANDKYCQDWDGWNDWRHISNPLINQFNTSNVNLEQTIILSTCDINSSSTNDNEFIQQVNNKHDLKCGADYNAGNNNIDQNEFDSNDINWDDLINVGTNYYQTTYSTLMSILIIGVVITIFF